MSTEPKLNQGILKHPAVAIYLALLVAVVILFACGMMNDWVPNRGITQPKTSVSH
jgi:ABC-type microcin C transport system permease subunit YejB